LHADARRAFVEEPFGEAEEQTALLDNKVYFVYPT
jgi:hypothetical protein